MGAEYWNAIAFDPSGRLNLAITHVAPPVVTSVVDRVGSDGSLTQVAGAATPLSAVVGLTFDAAGNLYIPDEGSGAVLRVEPNGVTQTVVSDPGVAGVAFDRAGHLFLAAIDRIDEVTDDPVVVQLSSAQVDFAGAGSQRLLVTTNFSMPFAYTVKIDGGTWLSVNRAAAVTGEPVTLTADPAGLAAGLYRATVTIRVGEQTAVLPVSLTLR